jgi:hypothetical protein
LNEKAAMATWWYKTLFGLSRLAIALLPFGIPIVIYGRYPAIATVLGVLAFIWFFLVVTQSMWTLGFSVEVPGEVVLRNASDTGPPAFDGKNVSGLVRFVAVSEHIERLPAAGRWAIHMKFRIDNSTSEPIAVYDIRFHVYCADTGPPLADVLAEPDRVEVTDTNSIMGEGQIYRIAGAGNRTFDLTTNVTREHGSGGFVLIFGAFAFCVIGDQPNHVTARIPCDSVFICQGDHLVRMNQQNIDLYKRKHEKSISGSILIAVCNDALEKQLKATSAVKVDTPVAQIG